MEVIVQKTKVEHNVMPSGVTYYFIGQPKTGKTTQASCWSEKGNDGVIVIDTDLGADFVDQANIIPVISYYQPKREVKKPNGQTEFEVIPPIERGYYYRNGPNKGKPMEVYSITEVWTWIKENWEKLPYDTIALDTIDQINEWIEDIVKGELNISEMGMGSYGADWAKAKRMNLDFVKKLQKLMKKTGGNLIITSHSKQSTTEDNKIQLGPALPGGLGRMMTAKADIIGFTRIDKKTGQYLISFKGYDERMVGSRIRALINKVLPFDYSAIKSEVESFKIN